MSFCSKVSKVEPKLSYPKCGTKVKNIDTKQSNKRNNQTQNPKDKTIT